MSEQKIVPETVEDIDFSAIPQPENNIVENWDPPPHVYYGKRMPNGKSEKEPVYTHQEYPRVLYGRFDGRVITLLANNDEDCKAALAQGWVKTPAELGILTAPSYEDAQKIRRVREAVEPETETATVEIVKRGPGRPRKAA